MHTHGSGGVCGRSLCREHVEGRKDGERHICFVVTVPPVHTRFHSVTTQYYMEGVHRANVSAERPDWSVKTFQPRANAARVGCLLGALGRRRAAEASSEPLPFPSPLASCLFVCTSVVMMCDLRVPLRTVEARHRRDLTVSDV